jgi:hypothetical protein
MSKIPLPRHVVTQLTKYHDAFKKKDPRQVEWVPAFISQTTQAQWDKVMDPAGDAFTRINYDEFRTEFGTELHIIAFLKWYNCTNHIRVTPLINKIEDILDDGGSVEKYLSGGIVANDTAEIRVKVVALQAENARLAIFENLVGTKSAELSALQIENTRLVASKQVEVAELRAESSLKDSKLAQRECENRALNGELAGERLKNVKVNEIKDEMLLEITKSKAENALLKGTVSGLEMERESMRVISQAKLDEQQAELEDLKNQISSLSVAQKQAESSSGGEGVAGVTANGGKKNKSCDDDAWGGLKKPKTEDWHESEKPETDTEKESLPQKFAKFTKTVNSVAATVAACIFSTTSSIQNTKQYDPKLSVPRKDHEAEFHPYKRAKKD